MPPSLAVQVGKNHFEVSCKLPQHLAARAAWRGRRVGWRDDDQAAERTVSLGERFENRDTLGAERQAVRGVLEVAAGEDGPVTRLDGGADLEMREVGAGMLANLARGGDQIVDLRIPDPGSRIPAGFLTRVVQ